LVLGIPNAVPIVARHVVPLESTQKMASELEAIRQEGWEQALQKIRELGRKKGWSREEEDRIDPAPRTIEQRSEEDRIITEMTRRIARRSEALNDSHMNRFLSQASVARIVSRISPSACFTYASTTLAGTGVDAYEKFVRYVYEDFRDQFEANLSEVESRWWQSHEEELDLTPLPEFALAGPTTELVLKDSLLDIGLLFIYNTLFFLGAFVRFLRYDVN
jgi:hypothetical protein